MKKDKVITNLARVNLLQKETEELEHVSFEVGALCPYLDTMNK